MNLAHYMYADGSVVFGVLWGVLGRSGLFRGHRFPKEKFSALYFGGVWDGFGWFWVVWGFSMYRTTAMLTDQIQKRVCLALYRYSYRFTDSSASRCRITHDIWYPARCSAAHKN